VEKRKRFTNTAFAVMMIGSLLAGCSSGKETAEQQPASPEPATSETPAPTAAPAEEPADDKSPIKITWFVDQDYYKKDWDPVNNLLDKMITDDTGISIEFTSGSSEKLSALIASGDIPDVITVDKISPQRGILEKSGLVAPLDELIEKYDPTFKVPQSMQDWFRNSDGHFYGYANYFVAKESFQPGDRIRSNQGFFARKDIMDQLGIKPEDFNTKEGLLAALRKVKDSAGQYNGFTVTPAYLDSWILYNFFGAPREDAQGNLVDRERTEEALEAYKFLNLLYREGLMPEDSQTLNKTQLQEKVVNGAVFAYTNGTIDWSALYQNDPNATFVHVGPVAGDKGNKPYVDPTAASGWTLSMINSKTKYPDRIIKMFHYLAEDEMSLNVHYGPKGAAWDYDENGRVKLTEEFNKLNSEDINKAKQKYGNTTLNWLINWMPIQRTAPVSNTVNGALVEEAKNHFAQYTYDMLPFESGTPLGGTEEAGINAKIIENRTKMRAKMILAKSEEEVEKFFNETIEQEEKLGYKKLYDYQNKMFLEAKKALGIQFAWPTNQK
jgi:putative aldouronate transport system substrate-binding protein